MEVLMKKRIYYLPLTVILSAAIQTYSQIPQQNNNSELQRIEAEKRIEAERRFRMQQMREFDATMNAKKPPERSVPAGPPIDKETSERMKEARKIDASDLSRYRGFLQAEKTGIFKLFPDHDCVAKNVIRIDGECKDFVFASSSWSFRNLGYSHPYYHDLGFNNGEIYSNAFFEQGMLVSIGDVPIESVTPNTDGLKILIDLEAASDLAAAKSSAAKLKEGFESGGFTYVSHVVPVENTTYVLRSIAYNIANSLPAVSDATSTSELRFHTLALDKRADIIVAFRIVRRGADGSLTLVWKELSRKDAPKIKFAKGEKFVDFKPDITQPK